MGQGLFVTGTDTGIGKTLVASALLHGFGAAGKSTVGMKPVAAGCNQGRCADVEALGRASTVRAAARLVNPYAFDPAIAPHIAASLAGIEIDLEVVAGAYAELSRCADMVVVEGVGGFMVPLNASQTSADLAARLGLPIILVVGMRLGCLSHALLARRQIDACRLPCAGWIANCVEPDMPQLEANIRALQLRLACPLIGIVPFRQDLAPAAAAALLSLDVIVGIRV